MVDFAVYLKRFASAFPHSSFGRTEDRSPPRNHFCETRSSSGSYVTQRGIQYINLERGDRDEEENSDGSITQLYFERER